MTNAFKPTIWKVVITIILLAIGYIASANIDKLPTAIYLILFLLFFPVLAVAFKGLGGAGLSFLIALIWIYFLVCLVIHTINVIRGNKKEIKMIEKKEGLSGWLILVQIFLLLMLFFSLIFGFGLLLAGAFVGASWGDIPFLNKLIFAFLFFGNIISMFLFYTKRRWFKGWFLIWIWIPWVLVFLVYGLSWPGFPEGLSYLLMTIIYLMISVLLTIYIKKSERVKNTFVK